MNISVISDYNIFMSAEISCYKIMQQIEIEVRITLIVECLLFCFVDRILFPK